MATTEATSKATLAPGDLPDPLDMPTKPDAGDADELISQLASSQIDKMLADANVDKAESVEPMPAPVEATQAEAELENPVAEATTQVEEPPVAAEHAVEATADEMSKIFSDEPSTLNDVSAIEDLSMDRAPQADSHGVEEALESVRSAAEDLARELEADAAVSPRRAEHASTPKLQPTHVELESNVGVRVGFSLLSAINAPFQNLSDNTRELLGSIAIITLVNAMSILLYVMIYR